MKKLIPLVLALFCALGLVGCGQTALVPPDADLEASFYECWPGTITDIFTEGGGADLVEVIQLEIKDHDPMHFTTTADTEYLRYDSDTEEAEVITKDDLYVGAWVEIDCESYHDSDYHPIFTIRVIASAKGSAQPGEGFDTAVSYANWADGDAICSGALNTGKMAISSVQHLPIYRFDTLDDLERFKQSFGNVLSMEQGYDEVPSFNEVIAGYDAVFFDENALMLVYVSAGSGSYRFGVSSVYCDGTSFCIHVEQTNHPEAVTDDMAGWFITAAVPDSMIEGCTEFDADLNNLA